MALAIERVAADLQQARRRRQVALHVAHHGQRAQRDLLALTTNAEQYMAAAEAIGIVVPEGKIEKKFSFELWTGLSGQACEPGVEEASGYLLLPFVNAGTIGDLTVDGENAISFSMTGAFTRGGNAWGVGPYDITTVSTPAPGTPAPLPTALDPLDHLLLIETALAPPPSACAIQAMPA